MGSQIIIRMLWSEHVIRWSLGAVSVCVPQGFNSWPAELFVLFLGQFIICYFTPLLADDFQNHSLFPLSPVAGPLLC